MKFWQNLEKTEHYMIFLPQYLWEGNNEKAIRKLHLQFDHCHELKLKKLVRNSGCLDKELGKLIEQVSMECKTCQFYQNPGSKPIVSLPFGTELIDVISIDLHQLFSSPPEWYVRIIDLHTRFYITYDKKAESIEKTINNFWIFNFGATKEIIIDNCGEFDNEKFRENAETFVDSFVNRFIASIKSTFVIGSVKSLSHKCFWQSHCCVRSKRGNNYRFGTLQGKVYELNYDDVKDQEDLIHQLRTVVGKIMWPAMQISPLMCFIFIQASAQLHQASAKTVSYLNKLVRTVRTFKNTPSLKITFTKLNTKYSVIICFTGASFNDNTDGTTHGGHLIFLTDVESKDCCISSWKSGKMRRVAGSTLAAECFALIRRYHFTPVLLFNYSLNFGGGVGISRQCIVRQISDQ